MRLSGLAGFLWGARPSFLVLGGTREITSALRSGAVSNSEVTKEKQENVRSVAPNSPRKDRCLQGED